MDQNHGQTKLLRKVTIVEKDIKRLSFGDDVKDNDLVRNKSTKMARFEANEMIEEINSFQSEDGFSHLEKYPADMKPNEGIDLPDFIYDESGGQQKL